MVNNSNIFDSEGMSYVAYRLLIDRKLSENQTTGPDHSPEMVSYSKMNVQRMTRLDKTVVLQDNVLEALVALKGRFGMLVISEGWCGDAAQILPVLEKIALASDGKLEMRIVLRDQNLELMDEHLTNGGRAIPVVLVLDREHGGLLAKWGPRPAVLQEAMKEWKKQTSDIWEISSMVHAWYAKDKTREIQDEMARLIMGVDVRN